MGRDSARLESSAANSYLECEKWQVYSLMMLVGGYLGAFTYSIRGGVFCNAQTGNFVLLAMALGNGEWRHALYFLIPISAYCLGAVVSEAAEGKRLRWIRWETSFIIFEMAAVFFLGLLPESAPVQVTQVLINFICSMQYNTFRQAQGIPMATTFCTNHIRQVGVSLYHALARPRTDRTHLHKLFVHLGMLGAFVVGGLCSAYLCRRYLGKALWFAEIPLGIVLADLLYADLGRERGKLDQMPHGHETIADRKA